METKNLDKSILGDDDGSSIELEDVQERERNTTMMKIQEIKNFATKNWQAKISLTFHFRAHMILSKFQLFFTLKQLCY